MSLLPSSEFVYLPGAALLYPGFAQHGPELPTGTGVALIADAR